MPSNYSFDLNEFHCIYAEGELIFEITPENGHVYDGKALRIIVDKDQVMYKTADQGVSFSKQKFAPEIMVGYLQNNIIAISFKSRFPNLVTQFLYDWSQINTSSQIMLNLNS